MATKAELAARLAQLEGENDRLAAEVTRTGASREQLEQRLAGLDQAYGRAVAERDALAADLAEVRDRHETLTAEHATLAAERNREQAAAVEPRVTVRWIRDSPPEGCHVGSVTYHGRGPVYEQAHGPGGRAFERLGRGGGEVEVPVGHAQVLITAGFAEPATARDDEYVSYDRLLHGALASSLDGHDDAAARWAIDDGLRRTPVPEGWPEELSYARQHPTPVEPVYGRALAGP